MMLRIFGLIFVSFVVTSSFEKPTCQLPSFTNLLPLNSRRELRKIWSGFHSTSAAKKCERQLAQTRELINGLAEDVKLRILDFDRPEIGGAHRKSTTNGMTFLTGLSGDEISQFSEIMSNRSVTHDQRYDMLRNWASATLDLDAINQVEQFIAFKKRKDVSFKNKIDKLSSEARIAHDKLESLRRLKQEVYGDLSEQARRELASLYRAKCPKGSVYEASDLDAEELQLACSVGEVAMPATPATPATTTPATTTTTTDNTPKQLSFEIQKQIAEPSEKPKGVASMFATDQERLEDLLKRIFNTKNLRLF